MLALDPPTLYGQAIPDGRVDAIVGWHQAGGDLATALASRYGCPALQAGEAARHSHHDAATAAGQ